MSVTATTQARVARAMAALTGEDPTVNPNENLKQIPREARPDTVPDGPTEP